MPDHQALATGRLTILRPCSRRVLTKEYFIGSGGQVDCRAFSEPKMFRVESAEAGSIQDLHRLLRRIETDHRACIIRAEPGEDTDRTSTRRLKRENGGTFDDVRRAWLMLDLDRVRLPPGTSVIDDPAGVARIILDMIAAHVPELEDVSAVVQFSSSAGLDELAEAETAAGLPRRWGNVTGKGGVGAHVWFWLETPADAAELSRWAAAINARVGHKFIDPATLRSIQVHYTAGPVFGTALRDPLNGKRTLLIEGTSDAATLDIPAVAERKAYQPGSNAHAGHGFLGWLEAIGGAEGFHDPINRAIASYIGTNWPEPDTKALTEAIAARVLAADPGGRSPSQIAAYADPGRIAARIAWTSGREEEKRAAEAEAAAAAEQIPPTYPERGMPLLEAIRHAGSTLGTFAERIAAGEVPQLLLRMTVGAGKTFAAIDALPALLQAGRAAGRGPALFTHPRHKLGDQIAADIRRRHPAMRVAVWRGMDAADPANPGQAMCQDPELPRAAKAAGQSATQGCAACPLADRCSYLRQAAEGRGADVWVAAHAVKFMQPFAGWPRAKVDGKRVPVPASVVIVDEDMTSAGIAGTDRLHPIQLALSALASDETPNLTGLNRDRLLDLRQRVLAGLTGQPAGAVFRDAVEWMREAPGGLGISPAREWAVLEWDCKPRVRIAEGTTRAEALAAFGAAQAQGFTRLRPILAERIAAFLATDDARSVNLTINPEAELGRGQGTGPAVRFAWRQDFHDAWRAPLLFLDATGRAEILRHWAPGLEVVDIEVQAPHQHVVQVADREFGRKWAITDGNIKRLADLLMCETAQANGPVLAVAQVAVERLLRKALQERRATRDPLPDGGVEDDPATYRFPSGAVLHLTHHGAVTGSNAWQDVATVVVIGRPATNRLEGERRAQVIAGRAGEAIATEGDTWWPTVPAALRMADGTGHRIEKQPRHPDPVVEASRWAVTEGAVLQAIGRPRGVRRSAAQPVRAVVLAALALPLDVAEVLAWEEAAPDRLTVAAAEAALHGRALPLAPADLAMARPDLWGSVRAAEIDLQRQRKGAQPLIRESYKGLSPLSGLTPARYRKAGGRGSLSMALVPTVEARAALEAMVGRLSAFELIPPDREEAAMPPAEAEPYALEAMGLRPMRHTPETWDVPTADLLAVCIPKGARPVELTGIRICTRTFYVIKGLPRRPPAGTEARNQPCPS